MLQGIPDIPDILNKIYQLNITEVFAHHRLACTQNHHGPFDIN